MYTASEQLGQQSWTNQDRFDHKKAPAKASGVTEGKIYIGDGGQRGGITDGAN